MPEQAVEARPLQMPWADTPVFPELDVSNYVDTQVPIAPLGPRGVDGAVEGLYLLSQQLAFALAAFCTDDFGIFSHLCCRSHDAILVCRVLHPEDGHEHSFRPSALYTLLIIK